MTFAEGEKPVEAQTAARGLDRLPVWLAARIGRMSGRRLAAILVVSIVSFNIFALMVVRSARADERAVVYSRYNDALVDGDLQLAWALGCASDRRDVSLDEFVGLFEQALQPLGGELQSWGRLRGGPEWYGGSGSIKSLPPIQKVDGHYCVRLGGNPLGDPF